MFKKLSFAFALMIGSFTAQAQDVTQDFTDYVGHYFLGSRSASDRVWDNTFCAVPVPGGCGQKGGSKIYGSASGQVDALVEKYGNGWYIDKQRNPWTGVEIVSHWLDLQMTFSYSGYSEGKKQCFPGDFYCGMEWDSLHPAGQIVASLKADGQKFWIEMTYRVDQGHGDKPNAVLRDAMYNLRPAFQKVVTDFVRMKGSEAQIIFTN